MVVSADLAAFTVSLAVDGFLMAEEVVCGQRNASSWAVCIIAYKGQSEALSSSNAWCSGAGRSSPLSYLHSLFLLQIMIV